MKTKSSKFMNIKRIEFIVTWQCGGRCKHCQIGNDINKKDSHRHVLSDYAVDAVKKLSATYEVTSIAMLIRGFRKKPTKIAWLSAHLRHK